MFPSHDRGVGAANGQKTVSGLAGLVLTAVLGIPEPGVVIAQGLTVVGLGHKLLKGLKKLLEIVKESR